MTNEEIKALKARVQAGDLMGKQEQLDVLQALFRANRRVMAARRAGFNTDPASLKPTA